MEKEGGSTRARAAARPTERQHLILEEWWTGVVGGRVNRVLKSGRSLVSSTTVALKRKLRRRFVRQRYKSSSSKIP